MLGFTEFIRRPSPKHRAWLMDLRSNRSDVRHKAKTKRLKELSVGAWLAYGVERFGLSKQNFICQVKAALSDTEFKRLTLHLCYEVKLFQRYGLDEVIVNTSGEDNLLISCDINDLLVKSRRLEAELLDVRRQLNAELQLLGLNGTCMLT